MNTIVVKIPICVVLLSLVGCGIRGPLFLPNVPPVPPAPSQPEPKGKLYPPKETNPSSANSSNNSR